MDLKSIVVGVIALVSRSYGEKDDTHIYESWLPLVVEVINRGSILNRAEVIPRNLALVILKLNKAQENEMTKFYMASYLMDIVSASQKFHGISWV